MREDWDTAISGEILDIRDGTHDTPKYVEEAVHPLVTSKNLKNGVIDLSNVKYISNDSFQEINKRSKVDIGDVLFAMIGTIGNPVVITLEPNYSIKNVGLFKNVYNVINSKLLGYYLDSLNFYSQLEKRQFLKGTTQKFIPLGHLRKLEIPIAPLPEQRAIVAKIEELFSDLDKGIADLKKAQDQLVIFRQAVLKKAFEGELTNSTSNMQTISFGDEIKIVSGNTPKGLKGISNEGNHQFYKVSDMNLPGNEVDMKSSNLKLTKDEIERLKVKIFPKGTIIFPKRGGAILTNKKRILSKDASFDLNVMGVIPNENYLSKYLYYFFISLDLGKICDGTAVPQINNKHIAPLVFPKCTVDIQSMIVQEIEFRLSVCDKVEQSIAESLDKAKALRQSILKKAFDGTLLSEDEIAACKAEKDYEPASILLKKIKAEKKK